MLIASHQYGFHSGGADAPDLVAEAHTDQERRRVTPDNYDELPYASMPYPLTQPSRIAAVAALHGLITPPVERARVLELGCASGGNLIPLAARFPDAQFLGIDLGRRHVDDANRAIEAFGLTNVEVRHADIAAFKPDSEFDYVICHGVFSWTPFEVQEVIFRICADALAENAVALVSFNVLPGWHLRNAVRDLCLRYDDPGLAPPERIAKVRALLNDIAGESVDGDVYGGLIRREAKRLAHRPASYIAGEFLAAHNAPCHVRDFLARARGHGLGYMAEADLEASTPGISRGRLKEHIESLSGGDKSEREQRVDDFTGRTFRTALLVRDGATVVAPRFTALKDLHLSTRWRLDRDQSGGTGLAFKDSNDRRLTITDQGAARAMEALSAVHPQTLSVKELATLTKASEDAVCERLFQRVRLGYVEVSSVPLSASVSAHEKPIVWSVARREAEAGQPWLTNRRHEPVAATPVVAFIARVTDGTRTRAAIHAVVSAALSGGLISTSDKFDDHSVGALAARYVDNALAYFTREALFS